MDPSPHRSRPEKVLRIGFAVITDVLWRFSADDGWAIASHIALTTLTSLFPFLIFMTALARLLRFGAIGRNRPRPCCSTCGRLRSPRPSRPRSTTCSPCPAAASSPWVPHSRSTSRRAAWKHSGSALNRAYGVRETRPWWLTRLESIVVVFIGAVASLMLAFLVVLAPILWSALLAYVPQFAAFESLVTLARYGLASGTLALALLIAHKWLPAERRTVMQVLPGITLTLIASILFSIAFGHYLQHFARNYASTYGGLASVMIALVFLYTMATIFVIGGELNAALIRWTRVRAVPRPGANVTRLPPPRSRFPRG